MPGDARAHLAPHDRHPQLITDHGPHPSPGRASGRGRGSGPGWDSGGSGPGGGSGRGGRGWSNGPGEGFWPGTGNRWPGAVRAGRHGVARVGRHGTDMAGRLGVAGAGWHGIAGRHGVARATGARASRLAIAGPAGSALPGPAGSAFSPSRSSASQSLISSMLACSGWILIFTSSLPSSPGVSRAAASDLPGGPTRRAGRSACCRPVPAASVAGCGLARPPPLRSPR